ncbi:MAG: potassium-transporting ATPase subunit F [Candidatus Nanopelagicales bacterium]
MTNVEAAFALLIAILMLVYLVIALLKPEWF